MAVFSLKPIESIQGIQSFEQLVIDGTPVLDAYEEQLEEQYATEFQVILAYMDFVARLQHLPDTKFKDITPRRETVREFEFKSRHLRVYAISKRAGKIVVLGGYKNRQKRDIISFRSLKRQYLEQVTNKNTEHEETGIVKK